MKIYHYTSIQTLALILKSRSIRFNRLDFVDDLEESAYPSGNKGLNLNLSKFVYVSCWTKNAEENLALWNMYTNNRGVRIAFNDNPFVCYQNTPNFYSFCESLVTIGEDYIMSALNNEAKPHEIIYVDSPKDKIKDLIKEGNRFIHMNTRDLGLYKDSHWRFQNECRFRIILYHKNEELIRKCMTNSGNQIFDQIWGLLISLMPALAKGPAIKETELYMKLNEDVLNHIEVMLGPQTTDADKYIVENLLAEFPQHTLTESHFRGKIRSKF